MEPFSIQANFDTFRTLADGGLKFTFATHESMANIVAKLVPLRGENLYIVVMTEDQFNLQSRKVMNG